MAISASSILTQVARDLNDETSIRWTARDLVAYFNDGQRDILSHRPDARNVSVIMTLEPGSKQWLPDDGEKLIDVLHNETGNRTAITPVDRRLLDSQVRGWRGLTGQIEILHYVFDELDPKTFDVYPPAAAGAEVRIKYAAVTEDIATPDLGATTTSIVGEIGLSDLFANAMRNYVMFRAYSKQTEYTANPNLAMAFYSAYTNDIGIEAQGTSAVSPNQGATQ